MAPELFARRTVDAVLRNRAVIVVPRWWKTFWYLERLSPSLSLRLADAMYARRQAELAVAVAHAVRPATAPPGTEQQRRA